MDVALTLFRLSCRITNLYFPVLRFLASPDTHPEEGHLFIAVSTIIAVLALGTWWFFLSEAAVARRREEKQRVLERPDHDHARALEIAKMQSELQRWTGTGV